MSIGWSWTYRHVNLLIMDVSSCQSVDHGRIIMSICWSWTHRHVNLLIMFISSCHLDLARVDMSCNILSFTYCLVNLLITHVLSPVVHTRMVKSACWSCTYYNATNWSCMWSLGSWYTSIIYKRRFSGDGTIQGFSDIASIATLLKILRQMEGCDWSAGGLKFLSEWYSGLRFSCKLHKL